MMTSSAFTGKLYSFCPPMNVLEIQDDVFFSPKGPSVFSARTIPGAARVSSGSLETRPRSRTLGGSLELVWAPLWVLFLGMSRRWSGDVRIAWF